MKRWIAILLAAVLLTLSGCAASGTAKPAQQANEAEKADWTVLFYLCGTDLESESSLASGNLEEIAATTPNASVNVLIETGGTREWHAESAGLEIAADKLQRYRYDEQGYTLLEEQELKNMASAQTLTDFIRWGAGTCPAKKYLLCLWDHGGGSNGGLIVDEKFGSASMSAEELGRAVSEAGTAIETVVLDACMMANLETAQVLSASARYMVASEELVSGTGTAYQAWLQYLYDHPDCGGAEFGRAFCDEMQQKYADQEDEARALTFFSIDLSQTGAVTAAFAEMSREMTALLADSAEFRPFALAAEEAEHYDYPEMIDLVDLASRARGNGLTEQTADAVVAAVGKAVLYGVKGKDHSGSNGLSFWYQPSAYSETLDHYARSSTQNPDYLAFLDAVSPVWSAPEWVYETVERPTELPYSGYMVEQEVRIGEDGGAELAITNAAQAVASVTATLYCYDEENDRWLCYGGAGQVQEAEESYASGFDGQWLALNGMPCQARVAEQREGYTLYNIPVRLKWEGGYEEVKFLRAALRTDGTQERFELLGLWDNASGGDTMPSRDEHALSAFSGAALYPLLTAGDPACGLTEDYVETGEGFAVEEAELSRVTLPDGWYAYSFVSTDLLRQEHTSDLSYLDWDGETATFELAED